MTGIDINLPPQYEAQQTEAKWQKYWEENETFEANPEKKRRTLCHSNSPSQRNGKTTHGPCFQHLID